MIVAVRRTRLVVESYDLGSLRLYREDLQAIATAVAEAGDLKIGGRDFEATSPADFEALDEHLTEVTILAKRATEPGGIQVRLSRRAAVAELVEPDTLTVGILVRIRLICGLRRMRLRSLMTRPDDRGSRSYRGTSRLDRTVAAVVLTVASMAAGSLAYLSSLPKGTHATAGWTTGLSIVVAIVAAIAVIAAGLLWLASRQRVVIVNAPRADRPTYWELTHDLWLIGTATALVGAVAGYLLGSLT